MMNDARLLAIWRQLYDFKPILFERLKDVHEGFEGDGLDDVAVHAEVVAAVDVLVAMPRCR